MRSNATTRHTYEASLGCRGLACHATRCLRRAKFPCRREQTFALLREHLQVLGRSQLPLLLLPLALLRLLHNDHIFLSAYEGF